MNARKFQVLVIFKLVTCGLLLQLDDIKFYRPSGKLQMMMRLIVVAHIAGIFFIK